MPRRFLAMLAATSFLLAVPTGCGRLMTSGGTGIPEEAVDDFAVDRLLPPYGMAMHGIAFSRDGERVATLEHYFYPKGERTSAAFAPPGRLRIWQLRDGLSPVDLASLSIDGGGRFVQFTPDGRAVVFGSKDGTIFWDIESRSTTRTLGDEDRGGPIVSPDGRLAAWDRENGVIEIVSLVSDAIVGRIETADPSASTVKFTPDSQRVLLHRLIGGVLTLDIRVVASGESIAELPGAYQMWVGPGGSTPISRDGRFLLHEQTGKENTLRLTVLDVETKLPRAVFEQTSGPLWCAAFSPDGRLVAVGSEAIGEEKAKVTVWDIETETAIASIQEESAWGVTAVAFSPDGKALAVGNSAGEVRLRRVPD